MPYLGDRTSLLLSAHDRRCAIDDRGRGRRLRQSGQARPTHPEKSAPAAETAYRENSRRGKENAYVTVRVRDDYLGCRSWLELQRDLPFEGTPVLSDEEFDRAAEQIEAIASDAVPVLA